MKGSTADYCQNGKRMITKPEAPDKLLLTSQLWRSKGKGALKVKVYGMETGTDLTCRMLQTSVEGQMIKYLAFVSLSILPPLTRFSADILN